VTFQGNDVHALLADEGAEETIRDKLRQGGVAVRNVQPITPSLEDVFVSLIAGAE